MRNVPDLIAATPLAGESVYDIDLGQLGFQYSWNTITAAGGESGVWYFTPAKTETITSFAVWTNTLSGAAAFDAGSVANKGGVYATDANGRPTGAPLAISTGTVLLTAQRWHTLTLAVPLAVVAGTKYALVMTCGAGTSVSICIWAGLQVQGAGLAFISNAYTNPDIGLANFREEVTQCCGLRWTYSDGTFDGYGFVGQGNAGQNQKIHGNYLTSGCAGVKITPDYPMAMWRASFSISFAGTAGVGAGKAGAVSLYIYKGTTLIAVSSNSVLSSVLTAVNASRRHSFRFATPIFLEQGVEYSLVVGQTSGDGDSTTNYMRLYGATGTGSPGGYLIAPINASGNQQHGCFSVSSNTGVANLATDAVCGHQCVLQVSGLK